MWGEGRIRLDSGVISGVRMDHFQGHHQGCFPTYTFAYHWPEVGSQKKPPSIFGNVFFEKKRTEICSLNFFEIVWVTPFYALKGQYSLL